MTWLVPLEALSNEQWRAVEADTRQHRLVIGAPGSGKTQILLHRAAYLRDLLGTPPARFHIFVYTNMLKGYIASALAMLDLPDDCVSTFDAWCSEYYRRCIDDALPRAARGGYEGVDFDLLRVRVREHVLAHVREPLFDFVLVDEGQDLDEGCYVLLRRIAKHLTVCADHRQQIYDRGSDEAVIGASLGLARANNTLLEAFRCSPYLLDLAAALVGDERRAAELRQQARTNPYGRETPVVASCRDAAEEKQKLIDIVRTRTLAGERVVILLPQTRQVHGFAAGLAEAGLETEIPRKRARGGTNIDGLDFNSDRPKLMTYHSAKGLTFDTVCMPRLVTGSFTRMSEERLTKLLFVGITRATNWVYLSGVSGSLIKPLVRLLELEGEGRLSVHRPDAGLFAQTKATPAAALPVPDPYADLL